MCILKNDKYRKRRGGYTRLMQIRCNKCSSYICMYQKDGSGNIRRMYIDRISEPKISIARKALSCPKGHILGIKIMFEKEQRPAIRLFVDAITKKVVMAKA